MRRLAVLTALVATLTASAAFAQTAAVVAIPANPESLDPQNTVDAVSNTITRNIFDFLVSFDEEMDLRPALATSWEFLDDVTLVLELRQGVEFHDGTPWNADAAIANLDRIRTGSLTRSDLLAPYVASVDAHDEYTIQLNLSVPFAPILQNLAHDAMGMISPRNLESMSNTELSRNPVGTGPFVFYTWQEDDAVRLRPNPDYWGGAPQLGGLIFSIVPEPSVRTALLLAGEIDMISGVDPFDARQMEANANVEVINKPSVNYLYLGLNNQRGPLTDPRVRRALNYATDNEAIIENLLLGYAFQADSPLPPAAWGYDSVGVYDYDLDRAAELLAEAGYPDGFEFNLIAPQGRYLMDFDIAEAVQASWGRIGVTVNLLTYDWSTLLSMIRVPVDDAIYDGFILNCGSRTGHASYCLWILFHTSNWAPVSSNRMYYSNPEVDRLLEEVMVTVDEEQQLEHYRRIQEIVVEDAAVVYLHTENTIVALANGLTDVEILPSEQYNFHQARFE